MGFLRMAAVVICALQITSVMCHRPHDSSNQNEKSINRYHNGICTLVDGSVATIHFPTDNEIDCHAIGTMMFCLISRLDLQAEAGMAWSIISGMLGVKKCIVPQHWLPADMRADGYDGCFHDDTAHEVYAGLKNAPNDEVMLALWDWGCENYAKVDAAIGTIFAEGIMGAEQLGTAWTGMMTGQQMATTTDPNRCTPNIQDNSFQRPIVDRYNVMHDNQNGFNIEVNARHEDGTWTLADGTVITPIELDFIDVPPPTQSPTPSPTTKSPTPSPTTKAPTEAPTKAPTVPAVFSAGHVTKSGAIATLAVAAVLAQLAY